MLLLLYYFHMYTPSFGVWNILRPDYTFASWYHMAKVQVASNIATNSTSVSSEGEKKAQEI